MFFIIIKKKFYTQKIRKKKNTLIYLLTSFLYKLCANCLHKINFSYFMLFFDCLKENKPRLINDLKKIYLNGTLHD